MSGPATVRCLTQGTGITHHLHALHGPLGPLGAPRHCTAPLRTAGTHPRPGCIAGLPVPDQIISGRCSAETGRLALV